MVKGGVMSARRVQGLLPLYIHPTTGEATTQMVSMGAMGDSYYEYLLKVGHRHVLTPQPDAAPFLPCPRRKARATSVQAAVGGLFTQAWALPSSPEARGCHIPQGVSWAGALSQYVCQPALAPALAPKDVISIESCHGDAVVWCPW